MNKDKLLNIFQGVGSINYSTDFVDDQIATLRDMQSSGTNNVREEKMILTIICSALKYYLEASPEGYGENIISITESLEMIYYIEDLLPDLLDLMGYVHMR